ncbi:9143_t:CDS:2, partial [Funneliformis mosseae]
YTNEKSNNNNDSTISQNINYAVSKLSSQKKSDLSDLDIIASTPLLEKFIKPINKKLEHKKVLLRNINENNSEVDINKARENNNKVFEKQNSLEHLSYANVTAIFLLQTGSYVIAMFNNILCIAQIIAMYEQKASMHSYIDTFVSNLKSLSYVSMKIYFYINDISVNEEALILKDFE